MKVNKTKEKADMQSKFYKNKTTDKVWWVDNGKLGVLEVSFDKKTILNLFQDYPYKFTKEEKEIFDKENPYWADFFKDRR